MKITKKPKPEWPKAFHYISVSDIFDPPSLFAKTLSDTIPIRKGKTKLLDIGCGSGIIGIYCLVRKGAQSVTFNDVQEEAILETRSNVKKQIKKHKIHKSQVAYKTSDFTKIPERIIAEHDLIVFNPPQLPMKHVSKDYLRSVKANKNMKVFRLGGKHGLKIVRKFFRWYANLDNSKPNAIIALSSFLGRKRIWSEIRKQGITAKILNETEIPLRGSLIEAANNFPVDERVDRSLKRGSRNAWTKKILTIFLSNSQEM